MNHHLHCTVSLQGHCNPAESTQPYQLVKVHDDVFFYAQVALEASSRLSGHEARMADLQKDVDSAQRLMRAAQNSAREAADEKAALSDKVGRTLEFAEMAVIHATMYAQLTAPSQSIQQ